MKPWLKDTGNRDLIVDLAVCRGWEDSNVLVMDIQDGLELRIFA